MNNNKDLFYFGEQPLAAPCTVQSKIGNIHNNETLGFMNFEHLHCLRPWRPKTLCKPVCH